MAAELICHWIRVGKTQIVNYFWNWTPPNIPPINWVCFNSAANSVGFEFIVYIWAFLVQGNSKLIFCGLKLKLVVESQPVGAEKVRQNLLRLNRLEFWLISLVRTEIVIESWTHWWNIRPNLPPFGAEWSWLGLKHGNLHSRLDWRKKLAANASDWSWNFNWDGLQVKRTVSNQSWSLLLITGLFFFYEAEFEFQVESICRHIAAINLEYLGSLRIGFQSALIVIKPSYCDGFFFIGLFIACWLPHWKWFTLEFLFRFGVSHFFWTAFYIFGVLLFICT